MILFFSLPFQQYSERLQEHDFLVFKDDPSIPLSNLEGNLLFISAVIILS